MTAPPERVLIVRLSALGDVLTTLPAVALLRDALPTARFAWAVEAPFAPLLEGLSGLDEIVPFRTKRWRRAPFSKDVRTETFGTLRQLRAFSPDLAIDFQGTLKSATVAWASGAAIRWGLGGAELREKAGALFYTNRSPAAPNARHVVERGLALARAVAKIEAPSSADRERLPFATHIPNDPSNVVAQFVEPLGENFLALQPGAGWKNKEWGADRFAAAATAIHRRLGLRSVVVWGPGEQDMANQVVSLADGAAILAPPTTLRELAALLAQAAVVIGGDTGPVHLAAGLGRPTLAILGPTASTRHAPWGPAAKVIEFPLACRPCDRRYESRKPCLEAISVESVTEAVVQLLA